MGYILEEITEIDNIEDIIECMDIVTQENEQTAYAGNWEHMGYAGFTLPSKSSFAHAIKDLLGQKTVSIYRAKEDCCGNKVVGLVCGALTNRVPETKYKRSGRIIFFWVHPKHRKGSLYINLYRKIRKFFKDNDCLNVTLALRDHQVNLINGLMKVGWKINTMELLLPLGGKR